MLRAAAAQHHSEALSLKTHLPHPPLPTGGDILTLSPSHAHSAVLPYLVQPCLLDVGAQLLHAAVDVLLCLQLGFHAGQVAAPFCPLQSHLQQAKSPGQPSWAGDSPQRAKRTSWVMKEVTGGTAALVGGPKPTGLTGHCRFACSFESILQCAMKIGIT